MKNTHGHLLGEPARIGAAASGAAGAPGRFWYWRGASGRRYIHSVYDLALLPPLPGAVYVAVRRTGAPEREALACGVLPRAAGAGMEMLLSALKEAGAEEVHVHLLASSPADAVGIRDDLRASLGVGGTDGLQEPAAAPWPGPAPRGKGARRSDEDTREKMAASRVFSFPRGSVHEARERARHLYCPG